MKQLFNKLSPKKRLIFLGFSLVFLLFIAYFLSIKKTIEAYRFYSENKNIATLVADAPAQIQSIRTFLDNFDENFAFYAYDRQRLFEAVNTFCHDNNLQLSAFSPEKRKIIGEYEIITTPIRVRGGFIDMIRLMFYIESQEKLGYIASCSISMEKDRRKRKEYLECSIYLQNINN